MRGFKTVTLGVGSAVLVLAVQGTAAGPAASSTDYVVGSSSVPGVDTGLVLKKGHPVTVTATGTVCAHAPAVCVGPDGDPSVDTMHSAYNGWVLPGAPAYGLVARVGTGAWVHVGSGAVTLSGRGDLVFAMNDEYGAFGDNSGSFTATVSTSRANSRPCYPGWGYGDANHEHCGPPGLAKKPSAPGESAAEHGSASDNRGNSGEHDNSSSNGSSKGKGGGKRP